MDWWNILIFGVIPVFTVTIIFFAKRRLLWIAPLVSSTLAFVSYLIALAPITIIEVFNNNEWRAFYILAMLMHLGIVIILTVFAYFVAHILKRKQK